MSLTRFCNAAKHLHLTYGEWDVIMLRHLVDSLYTNHTARLGAVAVQSPDARVWYGTVVEVTQGVVLEREGGPNTDL